MIVTLRHRLYVILLLAVALNIAAWIQVRSIKAEWTNVPPVPSKTGIVAFALGDQSVAFCVIGIMLQNLGDTGGRSTRFKDYDYETLTNWFYLADELDPLSNFPPMLAGFYYGAVEDPEKLKPLAEYLHMAGSRTEGEKWRWLAQAIYLERYKIKDMDTAYKWAQELAVFDKPDMPIWTKQMPAFILNAEGDKQAAYDILVEMLKTGKGKMVREEVNAMTDYICDRILGPKKAKTDPVCQNRVPKN